MFRVNGRLADGRRCSVFHDGPENKAREHAAMRGLVSIENVSEFDPDKLPAPRTMTDKEIAEARRWWIENGKSAAR